MGSVIIIMTDRYLLLDPLIQSLIDSRKQQKVTQAQLAEAAGVSRKTVGTIEAGGDCTLSTLRALYAAVGLDLVSRPFSAPTLDDVLAERENAFSTRSQQKYRP